MIYDKDGGGDVYTPTASAPAPTAAPAPAPAMPTYSPPIQLTPGSTPDYAGLIKSDPGYLSAAASTELSATTAATKRKQALQQAVIQYGGGVPAGFTDPYGDIDQATQDQAKANQHSVLAQLARSYDENSNSFKRGLAARGALQSGDLAYGQDQLANAYGQQQYDAGNAFGSQVNSAVGDYAGVLGQNAQALSGAIQGAESNVYSNPAYRPVAATSATYDAGNSTAYGQPIYIDPSGNMYDLNGNPFKPGPSNAIPAPAPSTDADGAGPYVAGPADTNGVPMSAGFYGFDANGNWIG